MSDEDPVPAEDASVWFSRLTPEQQSLFTTGLHTSLRKTKTLLGIGRSIREARRKAAQEIAEYKDRIRASFRETDEQLRRIREELESQGVVLGPSRRDKRDDLVLEDVVRFDFVDRIHPGAQKAFFDGRLGGEFMQVRTCEAFVMSVDLRRSTDLMLKSRSADLFASFISDLSTRLRAIILDNHGVFDKFTGDGILAFFPAFYTGTDGFHVIAAAEAAHSAFGLAYQEARPAFKTVLSTKEVGLGIGIDHGMVNVVVIGESVTIVGAPVVYACRLAGAPEALPGTTLVNQPAYEKLAGNKACTFTERQIQIKHEGESVVYVVQLSGQPYTPQEPAWRALAPPTA